LNTDADSDQHRALAGGAVWTPWRLVHNQLDRFEPPLAAFVVAVAPADEPIAILLMVLFTFVGAAASYRAGAHMAVQVLSERLPAAAQPFVTLFVRLAMAAIALFMLIWGYKLCVATWNQYLSTLTWMRVGISYAPIPLGGLITLLFVIEQLLYGDQSKRRVVDYEAREESKESV